MSNANQEDFNNYFKELEESIEEKKSLKNDKIKVANPDDMIKLQKELFNKG